MRAAERFSEVCPRVLDHDELAAETRGRLTAAAGESAASNTSVAGAGRALDTARFCAIVFVCVP
jgi:hypothetical protein